MKDCIIKNCLVSETLKDSFFKSFIEEPEEAYTGDDKEDTPDDNKGGD